MKMRRELRPKEPEQEQLEPESKAAQPKKDKEIFDYKPEIQKEKKSALYHMRNHSITAAIAAIAGIALGHMYGDSVERDIRYAMSNFGKSLVEKAGIDYRETKNTDTIEQKIYAPADSHETKEETNIKAFEPLQEKKTEAAKKSEANPKLTVDEYIRLIKEGDFEQARELNEGYREKFGRRLIVPVGTYSKLFNANCKNEKFLENIATRHSHYSDFFEFTLGYGQKQAKELESKIAAYARQKK